jgi:hypothetical protein
MDSRTKQLVRDRAGNCCEYCGLGQDQSPLASLQIEHVRPRKHGGNDSIENLALACIDCNLSKGSNLTGIDPATSAVTELFNPRLQHWSEHFERHGAYIVGRTSIGRTTVAVLNMNSDDQVALRRVHGF